jgi:hypothetical protein
VTTHILILTAALALASPWAAAQSVWRCGNSYSEQPCTGGNPVTVTEPVTGSPGGTPVGLTDAKLAADLEKARLARERSAPKAIVLQPATPVTAPPVAATRNGTTPKTGKLEQFTAVSPGQPKEKKAKPKAKAKKARD